MGRLGLLMLLIFIISNYAKKADENRKEYGKNEIRTNTNASKWRLLGESLATPFTVVSIILT